MNYSKSCVIAWDQLINAVLGGSPDETLSSRAYRMEQKKQPYWGWTCAAINKIFFWQNNHCRGAYAREKDRSQLPEDFEIL